ncbi:AAA family ATPase [bacterium]|nr:AAA family ATPase [bacterium]
MQIKEADIFQFGKLQNKNISFEPGMNVIYGKNEAGKSTLHSFLCAMLFGMEKGRGRSSVTDAYSQYEPWHAPSFYAGALRFTVGQQKFYLERNFYSKEKTDYLRNELDGEELSVGFGDLTMLLGGVSKESYTSTYDITQAGAATGNQMVKILAEYLAQASDGSDSGVTVAEAVTSLNARKRELQQEQRRADEEREARLRALQLEKNLLEQECDGIRASLEKYEAHYADDESGMHAKYHEQTGSTEKTGYILSFVAILTAIILLGLKVYITPALFWTGELAALTVALFSAIRQYKKNQNRAKLQAAFMQAEQLRKLRELEVMEAQMQQKKRLADQMLTEWKDSLQEKENRLFNLGEEITRQSVQGEAERQRAEDIQALELAAQEIKRISQSFYEDMQDELNAEISRYVSLFTAGTYDSVRLDEQGQLQILTEGREVRPELLSRGTLEQIYLALRLAVGNVVTKEEPLPILLDEAFAMYDDDRLAQTLQTLSTLQNQIFLFTCQKREVEMLRNMNLDYNLIEM